MKIKLKTWLEIMEGRGPNAFKLSKRSYVDKLRRHAGKWLTVETEYLFQDQYNVVEDNLRIMDCDVAEVADDARIGKMKCNFCGKVSEIASQCPKCNKTEFRHMFKVRQAEVNEKAYIHYQMRSFLDGINEEFSCKKEGSSDMYEMKFKDKYALEVLQRMCSQFYTMFDQTVRGTVYGGLGGIQYEHTYSRFSHNGIILGGGDTVVDFHSKRIFNIREVYIAVSACEWVDIHIWTDEEHNSGYTMCFPYPLGM